MGRAWLAVLAVVAGAALGLTWSLGYQRAEAHYARAQAASAGRELACEARVDALERELDVLAREAARRLPTSLSPEPVRVERVRPRPVTPVFGVQ